MASSDITLPSLKNVWEATSAKYFWGNNYGTPWEFAPCELMKPYHLNIVDLDYDLSNTSNSPSLIWLFSRLSWACRKGHLDAIKELKVKNFGNTKDVDSGILDHLPLDCTKYLLVAAAACGELQVVEYLWGQIRAPLNMFSVVSDLTKGYALNAIEHAAISGYIHVVLYLADQEACPRSIFAIPGLFQKWFDQVICENNSGTVESLLLLRTLIIKPNTSYQLLTPIDSELSDTLVKAITNGRTEVVRLMLKHGLCSIPSVNTSGLGIGRYD
jgi:hypothetical protein